MDMANQKEKRGLYIHIPFCIRKCAYCDFYSLPHAANDDAAIEAYIKAVLIEAKKYQRLDFQTVYLGGGTPSLLRAGGLKNLMEGLGRIFDLSRVSEATMEANPESITDELLETALNTGINRISIGVQSLSDSELGKVGRIHNAAQAMEAIEKADQAGFKNISADGILGLPGQDWSSLMVTLETLCGLNIQHLSMYCLTIEPETPLARNLPPDLPSEDTQAELYENTVALLTERGFSHYEISNFALPGYECQHNLIYWRCGEYLGLGPAAASHIEGKRFKNKADLEAYLQNPTGEIEETEELTPESKVVEETILRLRLLEEGLDIVELTEKYGDENVIGVASRLNKLVKEGSIIRNGSKYWLEPSKALVSNSILVKVMGD